MPWHPHQHVPNAWAGVLQHRNAVVSARYDVGAAHHNDVARQALACLGCPPLAALGQPDSLSNTC